jgi:hypothetical protein
MIRFLLVWLMVLASWAYFDDGLGDVRQVMEAIPEQDLTALDRFFQLLVRENFAYTLFGQKPISSAEFAPPLHGAGMIRRAVFEAGWDGWLRHRNLFGDDHFVLKRIDRESSKTAHFFLVNKKYTLETIKDCLDVFRAAYGDETSPEEILNRLCDLERPMHDVLTSQFLWGIFFGFGRENAQTFEYKMENYKRAAGKMNPPFSPKNGLESASPLVREIAQCVRRKKQYSLPRSVDELSAFSTCFSELNNLTNREKGFELFDSDFFLEKFSLPAFVCWEGGNMTESFIKTRTILNQAYKKGSFLEVTLKQWVDPQ